MFIGISTKNDNAMSIMLLFDIVLCAYHFITLWYQKE